MLIRAVALNAATSHLLSTVRGREPPWRVMTWVFSLTAIGPIAGTRHIGEQRPVPAPAERVSQLGHAGRDTITHVSTPLCFHHLVAGDGLCMRKGFRSETVDSLLNYNVRDII